MKRKVDEAGLEEPVVGGACGRPSPEGSPSAARPLERRGDGDAQSSPGSPATPAVTTPAKRPRRPMPSDEKTHACPHCPKLFNRPARLSAHLRSHTGERPFVCSYDGCDRSYLEEKHLRQHVRSAHTHELAYACTMPGCGRRFVTATRLRRHVRGVHEGGVRCTGYDGCERVFRKRATLLRHVRADHLGLKPFVCREVSAAGGAGEAGAGGAVATCELAFDTAVELRRHVAKEHGDFAFWCDECILAPGDNDGDGEDEHDDEEDGDEHDGETGVEKSRAKAARLGFRTLAQLKEHVRNEHLNCIFCDDRSFSSAAQLEQHLETEHSGGKTGTARPAKEPVRCEVAGCGKTFAKKSNLKTHVRTVHECVRFVCGQFDLMATAASHEDDHSEAAALAGAAGCGAAFGTRANLERHIRRVHLGIAAARRTLSSAAAVAVETDAGLLEKMTGLADAERRTLKCPHDACTASFIRHHDLQRHMDRHHAGTEGNTALPDLELEQQEISKSTSPAPEAAEMGEFDANYALEDLLMLEQQQQPHQAYSPDGDMLLSCAARDACGRIAAAEYWSAAAAGVYAVDGFPDRPAADKLNWQQQHADDAELRQLVGGYTYGHLVDPALEDA